MENKEKNFLSVIVYLHNDSNKVISFFDGLQKVLSKYFEKYELIAVNDASTDDSVSKLKSWAKDLEQPLTILNMSIYQNRESSMNAGIDISIGDYVVEIDNIIANFDYEILYKAYCKCMEGNDVVSVCPTNGHNMSNIFYLLFNSSSNSAYKLKTDILRVVTRRGINRVHASSAHLPYRKAAYAASGLKIASLDYNGIVENNKSGRLSLAIDSLALYTSAGYKVSIGVTCGMLCVAIAEIVYTLYIYMAGKPVEGWTTTMLVLSFGLFGLFMILTIVLKYLILILDMNFRKQKYLVESIEKIQK